MNKKSIIYILLILTGAILLRLWHIDKPEGMWNDEYFTWHIAKSADFFEALKSNCHAPLHYLYLKLWMYIFNDSDKLLRLSSVVPGALGVLAIYFATLEYKKNEAAVAPVTAMVFAGISSFLIYFSQEVRIYSLTFFITTLVLLFAFKIFNNPSKKNFFFYSLFCLLLVLTHTIGFVFVAFSTAALLVFAVPKKQTKDFILFSILGVIVLALPFVPLIASILFKTSSFSQWWAPFNFSRTLFLFTDVFSPVLNDTSHVFNTFSDAFYSGGNVNPGYFIFAVIPTLIGLICFINGLMFPSRRQGYALSVVLCTLLTVLIAAMAGKLVFVTKYLIEIAPLFIIVAADGFSLFKSKGFKIALATVFIVLNLFYITVSNTSAVKMVRQEGQRLPVLALDNMGLKKNDRILFLYYPKTWFYKYVDFSNPDNKPYLEAMHITKHNFVRYLDRSFDIKDAPKVGKEHLHRVFASKENKILDDTLNLETLRHLNPGDRLFLVDLTSVSFFPMEIINTIASSRDEKTYNSVPLLYLAMSYIKDFTLSKAKRELVYDGYYDTGAWRIYVFKKPAPKV